ncbi:MAG: hypothetical protein ACHQUC_06215 [Chlamydiales bacterium]
MPEENKHEDEELLIEDSVQFRNDFMLLNQIIPEWIMYIVILPILMGIIAMLIFLIFEH